jgi:hypothetical protein
MFAKGFLAAKSRNNHIGSFSGFTLDSSWGMLSKVEKAKEWFEKGPGTLCFILSYWSRILVHCNSALSVFCSADRCG